MKESCGNPKGPFLAGVAPVGFTGVFISTLDHNASVFYHQSLGVTGCDPGMAMTRVV
jgi:hypothetical protein